MQKDGEIKLTVAEGYPSRSTEPAGLLRNQFVKTPRSFKWYDMHVDKKECDRSTVCSWSLEPSKLNSAFSRVARRNLPTAPPSRALSQDILRHWEKAAREQSFMCNLSAGLSRCLTRVQDSMSTQLKSLHVDKGKGKSSERMQQAVDELEYLVTFNRSISQVMARTMQKVCSLVSQTSPWHVETVIWNIYTPGLNRTRLLHCVLHPFIYTHCSQNSFS